MDPMWTTQIQQITSLIGKFFLITMIKAAYLKTVPAKT